MFFCTMSCISLVLIFLPQFQILFARAEALHAHGHTHEACKLAKQLAEDMLANPPDLSTEQPPPTGKGNVITSPQANRLCKITFI